VFWVVLNRSTTGYEVRAVGFNPEAARYGGMNVARNYVKVMAICGIFAGLAGGLDILGWQFRLATNDILASDVGFLGIAVALLGRNTASGTVAAALLFGALNSGTSQRNFDRARGHRDAVWRIRRLLRAQAGVRRDHPRRRGDRRRRRGDEVRRGEPARRLHVVGADRLDAALRHAAAVRSARRHRVRAQRS